MKYSDIETFLKAGLTNLGYDPLPVFWPGPATETTLQKKGSQQMVFIYPGAGAGFDSELLFDRPFLSVRSIGKQHSYPDSEQLAQDIDKILCSVVGNATVGTAKVLYITRTGGAPTLAEWDAGDRYHFTCTYITETQTGL